MRIVCSIGLRGGAVLVRRVLALTADAQPHLVLLHVIGPGPREDMAHVSGPLHIGSRGDPRHWRDIEAAEETAGRASLAEAEVQAQAAGVPTTVRLERGKPEQVAVAVARDVQASLVAIRAREHSEGHPFIGPKSVGHVARFVLDHAPCDVLLLREG